MPWPMTYRESGRSGGDSFEGAGQEQGGLRSPQSCASNLCNAMAVTSWLSVWSWSRRNDCVDEGLVCDNVVERHDEDLCR